MRHFQFIEPGENDEPRVVDVSEDELRATYYGWWQEQMRNVGKADQISFEACVEDFCAVHWATEVPKTFWLSFASEEQGFLGVAILEVDAVDAAFELPVIAANYPKARPGAEWIAAATRKARRVGCNPGGSVGASELPDGYLAADVPRNTLMQKEELRRRGLIHEDTPTPQ